MSTPNTDINELFDRIEQFTKPQTEKVDPADPASKTVTTPSLWDQLVDSTARRGGIGGSVQRSRPPVATEVLSLTETIRKRSQEQLARFGRRPIWQTRALLDRDCEHYHPRPDATVVEMWRDIPAELRAIQASPKLTENTRAAWIEQVTDWINQARAALGLTVPRIQLPRGTRCMDCGEAWVDVRDAGGEVVKQPALRLVWHPGGALHYVACQACGESRWPHDLHALADYQLTLNQQETLA